MSFAERWETGIQGQAYVFQPGFLYEVSPGMFIGESSLLLPTAASFTIYRNWHRDFRDGRYRRPVGHYSTDAGGFFRVELPPGNYVVVPDTIWPYSASPSKYNVTVTYRRFSSMSIYYQPRPFSYPILTISPLPETPPVFSPVR